MLDAVAICSLPAPARSAATPSQQRRARDLGAAGDDQYAAALVLVGVAARQGQRQRAAAQL